MQSLSYHRDRDCTYIRVTYSQCDFSEIASVRNPSGEKYYPCEYCCKEGEDYSTVFYMKYGTRYHSGTDCPNFHRNVFSIDLATAREQYRPCSKCGN